MKILMLKWCLSFVYAFFRKVYKNFTILIYKISKIQKLFYLKAKAIVPNISFIGADPKIHYPCFYYKHPHFPHLTLNYACPLTLLPSSYFYHKHLQILYLVAPGISHPDNTNYLVSNNTSSALARNINALADTVEQ